MSLLRLYRAKQTYQTDISRLTDENSDLLRQFEVLRREIRSQEKEHGEIVDRLKKEVECSRSEQLEANAISEELQSKLAAIQNAANATINDLVAELDSAHESTASEKLRCQKDDELLRTQLKYLEDDMKRKEIDSRDCIQLLKKELAAKKEKEDTNEMKLTKCMSMLESKKIEVEKMNKEVEQKQVKIAEIERKLNPLLSTRESMQQRVLELKQYLVSHLV